eukprot:m.62509 g.62509  ORF g.62509 m.62509 type:complete len:77 (-) comp23167_c0_seq2:129-359(-)
MTCTHSPTGLVHLKVCAETKVKEKTAAASSPSTRWANAMTAEGVEIVSAVQPFVTIAISKKRLKTLIVKTGLSNVV